jgi:hypothetical protein
LPSPLPSRSFICGSKSLGIGTTNTVALFNISELLGAVVFRVSEVFCGNNDDEILSNPVTLTL